MCEAVCIAKLCEPPAKMSFKNEFYTFSHKAKANFHLPKRKFTSPRHRAGSFGRRLVKTQGYLEVFQLRLRNLPDPVLKAKVLKMIHQEPISGHWPPGPWFNIKMSSYQYRKSHCGDKQRVLMHRHQRWNVRHGLCHIYMRYIYIWVVYSFCLFCCLFIIVTWWYIWCIVWQVASKRKYRHVW